MGLFNYIKIDKNISLPSFPKEIDREKVNFQTKDLDDNAMHQFRVTEDHTLEIYRQEGEWVNNPNIKFFGAEFKVEKEYWEFYGFTGNIRFYESYEHDENVGFVIDEWDQKEWLRFERGWVEYKAKFIDGVLVDIDLIENRLPVKRTDEEIDELVERQKENREKFEKQQKKTRKEHPTVEQKLIDDIYDEVMSKWGIPTMEDYGQALNKIREKIDNYRKQHDRYYERES